MPKGYGRASNPTRRKTVKTIKRTEAAGQRLSKERFAESRQWGREALAGARVARDQLASYTDAELANRMRQAAFERETLVPSVRNAPSNFEVNAREQRNRARQAAYEQKKREDEKRRRAGPTNTISPGAPPRRKKK